ncbi:hypothetical protein, partial [Stenotrophomonas cyclobalanopsidis]|uniref:hypothetical protein n=1 Tax=Stenotrophomonas cyclobalanopsidis TaxID=2771362 RepID=UPI002FD95002
LQVRPCKLGRRIHAAHAPSQPTLPATDTFPHAHPGKSTEKSKSGSLRSHSWGRQRTALAVASAFAFFS